MRQVAVAGALIALVVGCGRTMLDAPVASGAGTSGRGGAGGGAAGTGPGRGGAAGMAEGRGGAAGMPDGRGGAAGAGQGGSVAGTGQAGTIGTGTGGAPSSCSDWRVGVPVLLDAPAGPVTWTGREFVTSWITTTAVGNPEIRGVRRYFLHRLATDVDGNVLGQNIPHMHEMIVGTNPTSLIGRAWLLGIGAAAPGDGVAVLFCAAETDAPAGQRALFMRIGADGVAATPPVAIGSCDWQGEAALLWDAGAFTLAWTCAGARLCVASRDRDGAAIRPDAEIVTPGLLDRGSLRVVSNGRSQALIWNQFDSLRGRNVFVALPPAGAPKLLNDEVRVFAERMSFSPSAGSYLAVWNQRAIRRDDPIDPMGYVLASLDAAGNIVGPLTPLPNMKVAALAYDGRRHAALVAESAAAELSFVTFEPGTSPGLSGPTVLAWDSDWPAEFPSLIWHGTGYGLFWIDRTGTPARIGYRTIACR